MNKIKIIGIGPGSKDYILPIAYKEIEESDILIGSKRQIDIFSNYKKEVLYYKSLEDLGNKIEALRKTKKIGVLVSGDTGFYSLLDFIRGKFGKENILVIPGISSFQYIFSKLKLSYKNYQLLSLHGRDLDLKTYLDKKEGLFLLTDKVNTPSLIASKLSNWGYENYKMIVGENLSYYDEKIEVGKVEDFINKEYSNLSVVVINCET